MLVVVGRLITDHGHEFWEDEVKVGIETAPLVDEVVEKRGSRTSRWFWRNKRCWRLCDGVLIVFSAALCGGLDSLRHEPLIQREGFDRGDEVHGVGTR